MRPYTRYQLTCAPVFKCVYVFVITAPCFVQLGLDLEELEEIEEDAGLGNGGLGRLAGESAPARDRVTDESSSKSKSSYRFCVCFSLILLWLRPFLQLVSWTPWRLSVWLRTDTGFATSLESSIRKSITDGR